MVSLLWKSGRKASSKQVKQKKVGSNHENKGGGRGSVILI